GQYAGVAHPTDGLTPPEPVSGPTVSGVQAAPAPVAPISQAAFARGAAPMSSTGPAPGPAPRSAPGPASGPRSNPLALVPKFFTEQAGERKRFSGETGGTREMSGLWLVLSITVIILTAFGAGFLIMRPLLSDR
ncbi:MAG: hypothetical protein AAFZ80_03425, partial [Cyanobacteria bacterium P01_A01_bin.105]